jgi:O-antigen/teichoic acid export membrane protein
LIVTWTVLPTLTSALNARRQGVVLLSAGVVNVVVNLALTLALGYVFGIVGVALATTIVSVVVIIYMGYRVARLEPDVSLRPVWRTLAKASLASLPGALLFGIPIWTGLLDGDFLQRVALLAVVGVAGLSSYYALARRLGLDEASAILAFGKSTLRRAVGRFR